MRTNRGISITTKKKDFSLRLESFTRKLLQNNLNVELLVFVSYVSLKAKDVCRVSWKFLPYNSALSTLSIWKGIRR